jgi:hypothetical protein
MQSFKSLFASFYVLMLIHAACVIGTVTTTFFLGNFRITLGAPRARSHAQVNQCFHDCPFSESCLEPSEITRQRSVARGTFTLPPLTNPAMCIREERQRLNLQ